MTITAETALLKAIDWLKYAALTQGYGKVCIEVTMNDGNPVLIKRWVEETDKP